MIPLKDGFEWFSNSSDAKKNEIMKSLDYCIYQSHPTVKDIEEGLIKSNLKETYSPCVLIRKKPFSEVRQKVLRMNGLDQERSFKLLLSVFSVADERRRKTQCIDGCDHEWHQISGL
ncbi:DUF5958 family protein [Reinekea marina]|uniref:DUF5958 family protein n=1 Tax=Reinekea marina TaxID=1310421 RepID=UPI0025B48653|nr:DUF5958 family protein [Reinekea marina]MDN3649605.1 DUF5958 family protein [Reinekea marina]